MPEEDKYESFWTVGGERLRSRLFLGTARYPSLESLLLSLSLSKTEVVTVSLRRQLSDTGPAIHFWNSLLQHAPVGLRWLPNTAGCRTVKEAITTAHMARDIFKTSWIKLETVGDELTLQPDPFALVEAARILTEEGFVVFPYTTEDLVINERLLHAGCTVLMPWGSPIGSAQGLWNISALKMLRARFPQTPMIIDAGLGSPSQACQALELGFDGVLLNSAVALSADPVLMAQAFAGAVESGRQAYLAGLMSPRDFAQPSSPVWGRAFV